MSKEAFTMMKSICKYHLFEKRDGSIVNQILSEDGKIINDKEKVDAMLIDALKGIQLSDDFQQYVGKIPFPELPRLESCQVKGLLKTFATGKAMSFDLFTDIVLKDAKIMNRLSDLLTNL